MSWSIATVADAFAAGLEAAEDDLRREQTTGGLDTLAEVELHPILAAGAAAAGFGVAREARFPSDRELAERRRGRRCDLVLTPDGRALEDERRGRTLFDPTDAVAPADALWVEVKGAARFVGTGPQPGYATLVRGGPTADIRKLARDERVRHGAVALLLATVDEDEARADVAAWLTLALDDGLPFEAPAQRTVPIVDRRGNGVMHVALVPTVRRWHDSDLRGAGDDDGAR